jgi:hypothetical protein
MTQFTATSHQWHNHEIGFIAKLDCSKSKKPHSVFLLLRKFKQNNFIENQTTEANKGLSQIQFKPHAKDMILPTSCKMESQSSQAEWMEM